MPRRIVQSKHQWYIDGVDSGPPSITFDFKRLDRNKIKNWPPEKKKQVIEWLDEYVQPTFGAFVGELRRFLQQDTPPIGVVKKKK